jgi:hypothetical protein
MAYLAWQTAQKETVAYEIARNVLVFEKIRNSPK